MIYYTSSSSLMTFFNIIITIIDTPLSSLMDSIASPKMKTMEGKGIGAHSLACNTSRVEGHAGAPGWGLQRLTNNQLLAQTKQQVG